MRKRVESVLADCLHITQDVPHAVWESFLVRVEVVAYELLLRLKAEEEAEAALARHLDQCEKELGVGEGP